MYEFFEECNFRIKARFTLSYGLWLEVCNLSIDHNSQKAKELII
jgi:hypothetical protein